MKRVWMLVLIGVLVLGLSSMCFAETKIKDVNSSHWAYKSVTTLIDKGYLSLYEDSTFRGDRSVTRYQLAEIVAKILQNLENGTTSANQGDINTIRQLTVEFRKELVDLVQNQNLFANRAEQLEKNQVVMKEDIARSQAQILEMIDQLIVLKELQDKLNTTQGDVAALQEQIASVEKNMADGLSFSVTDLNSQIEEIKVNNQKHTQEIQALKDTNDQLQVEIDDLKDKNQKMVYYMIGGLLLALLIR